MCIRDRFRTYASHVQQSMIPNPEKLQFTTVLQTAMSVSYTHLDVYKRQMPKNPALVETIVTTDMAKAIAKAYGVKLIEVLTGFKYCLLYTSRCV